MKMSHVLLGAGAVVVGYIAYEHYFAKSTTPQTPGEQITSGIGKLIAGAQSLWSGLTGKSNTTSATPSQADGDPMSTTDATTSARPAPQPGLLIDLDRSSFQQRTPKMGLGRTPL